MTIESSYKLQLKSTGKIKIEKKNNLTEDLTAIITSIMD